MFNSSVILFIIILFIDLSLGLLVLIKGSGAKANRTFFVLAMLFFVWIGASFLEDEIVNPAVIDLLLKIDYTSAFFAIFYFSVFCFDLAEFKIRNSIMFKIAKVLFFSVPAIFGLLVIFTNSIVVGFEILPGGINPILGRGEPLYDLFIVLYMILGLAFLARRYRTTTSEKKAQIFYVILGLFIFLLIAILTNVVLVDLIKNSRNYTLYSRFGIFSSIFFILFSGYSIVKHRLLNLKVIATEVLSLGILIFSLLQVLNSQTSLELIFNGIIFLALLVLIIMLVRSVENEVKRKNQLQKLTDSLAETNDKLRVINAKLERIDATKTDFIYIASHQLHKVPTPIKGYLSMLLEGSYGKLSKEQRRVLENIKLANDRQINLVDDLLNVSRMEYGKVKLDFKEQQLEDVCQEIYDTVRPVAEEKGLKFTYEKPKAALPKLILDKGKIFEAIFNFVDNAVKYTSKGRINLKIETDINSHCELSEGDDGSRGLLSGPVIRVTVADTGVGIAKESLPFLFAKFSRNDKANLNIEGTGLGLYVVKLMIEAHGGRTWAESDGEGEGSRFIIEIPTKQPENVVVKE